MDLTPFAGHTIDLYFTTWQDGAFTLQMMYVDDISIPEIGFSDDVEVAVEIIVSFSQGTFPPALQSVPGTAAYRN